VSEYWDNYYNKNREKILIKMRQSYKNNPNKKIKANQEWRKNHPDYMKKYCKIYYSIPKNKNRKSENSKRYDAKQRMIVINHYSDNKNTCSCCGENIFEFLTIDHINGGGHEHIRKIVKSGHLYGWLIKHEFPVGYDVLCMNCNWAKGKYSVCPHKRYGKKEESN
jgi:hypothetical protein